MCFRNCSTEPHVCPLTQPSTYAAPQKLSQVYKGLMENITSNYSWNKDTTIQHLRAAPGGGEASGPYWGLLGGRAGPWLLVDEFPECFNGPLGDVPRQVVRPVEGGNDALQPLGHQHPEVSPHAEHGKTVNHSLYSTENEEEKSKMFTDSQSFMRKPWD